MRTLWSALTLISALALAASSAQAQNLLGNPSLDNNPDPNVSPWTLTESATGTALPPANSTAELVDFGIADGAGMGGSRHSGALGLWLREFEGLFFPGTFPNSTPTNAILTQTVAGTAGTTYQFTGWARWEQNYSGGTAMLAAGAPGGARPSPTQTYLELAFLNAGSTVLSTAQLDLRGVVTNGGPWAKGFVSAVAPAGTASVRVTAAAIDMVPNVDPGQSAFFDDFSLTVIPEPSSLGLAGIALMALLRRRK
jgi:hypothetical protein